MSLTGALGRLFFAQGLVAIVLAVVADGHERPAAAWVLAFVGFALLSTGMVLWLFASEVEDAAMKAAVARGRQRAGEGRSDWEDQ
jgi:drug/metabolite transporter (DMT)-like permease